MPFSSYGIGMQMQEVKKHLELTSKFGLGVQNEAGQRLTVLSRECPVHSKYQTQDGQFQSQTDYILRSQRWGSSTQSAKTKAGADYGSDQLLTAKFRFKLKQAGKTTRPFRYDLNQISYDYTVWVTNRFKGLDLVDRVPEELLIAVGNIT